MLMDEKEAGIWRQCRTTEANGIKMRDDCDAEKGWPQCRGRLASSGMMRCDECSMEWDRYCDPSDECNARKELKQMVDDLGCRAYEKVNGITECKPCNAQFVTEMRRPPHCIALQKMSKSKIAKEEPKQSKGMSAAEQSKLRMGKYEKTAADIMAEMIKTYNDRSTTYGHNFEMVGEVMKVFFPQGVPPELVITQHWHLFETIIIKLSRFATSGLSHIDSIHDAAVYGAIIEMILTQDEKDKEVKK